MNAIQEVVKLAHVPNPQVEGCNARKNELMMHYNRLLPVESHLKAKIENEVRQIDRAIQKYLGAHEARNGGAPLHAVDSTVLTWRHPTKLGQKCPIPSLALINVGNAEGRMSLSNGWERRCTIPHSLSVHYNDVFMALEPKDSDNWNKLSFTYTGAIPSDIRTLIQKERPNFESVHLLVDAPREGWHLSEHRAPKPVHVDPLVLGFRSDTLYLLGQFDPTPVEKYIAEEFTTRPALTAGN